MKKFPFLFITSAIMLMTIAGCKKETTTPSPTEGVKYQTFKTDMRVLWSDHSLWTRNVITNIVDGTPGTNEAVARLLKNQEDIGNAIKPYYGEAGGNGLTDLLHNHITIAADLLTAAKTNNT